MEFGEQVLAKPKMRNKQVKKKRALEPRFHDPTWVGYNDRSNEHIVVLKGRRSSNQGQDSEAKSRRRTMERDCNQGHRGDARHDQPEG